MPCTGWLIGTELYAIRRSPRGAPVFALRKQHAPTMLASRKRLMFCRTRIVLYLICGLFASVQPACHSNTAREEAYLHEVRFRSAWDYAIGRMTYSQVVNAWGPPTSITSGVAVENTPLDVVPIHASWHFSHPVPTAQAASPRAGTFGQRMELMFSRGPELLLDWRYWEWGAQDISYRH